MKSQWALLFLLVALIAVPASFADTFTLQSYNLTHVNTNSNGLEIDWAPVAQPLYSFQLNPGESNTFHLFDIWTPETTVNPDDLALSLIQMDMYFDPPDSAGTVVGDTQGHKKIFGGLQWGSVTWTSPATVFFGNGGQYTITLSNETFNGGVFGLDPCPKHGATVDATITYDVAPTPEPSSMMLLGTGLLGGIAWLRRR
jgi:hypothetical protein